MKLIVKITHDRVKGFALLYLIAWCISPPLGYGTIYRLLALAIIMIFIALNFANKKWRITVNQMVVLSLLAYMVCINLATGDSIDRRIGTYILLCMMLATSSTFDDGICNAKSIWWVVPITFFLCILWNVLTLREISITPTIMRILAKNTSSGTYYANRGVGGYGYMYSVLALIPIGIDYMLKQKERLWCRAVAVVFVVTSYTLVFRSQYFMAILVGILIPFLYYGFSIENRNKRILILIITMFIFGLVYVEIDWILARGLEIFSNQRSVTVKINDLYSILNGGDIYDSEFSTRFTRYIKDINYVFYHPILGGLSYSVTGNHSFVLDVFAQYGVFIGLICILHGFIKPITKFANGITIRNVVLVVFLIIATLNVVPFAMGAVLFVVLPIYEYSSAEEIT